MPFISMQEERRRKALEKLEAQKEAERKALLAKKQFKINVAIAIFGNILLAATALGIVALCSNFMYK